LVRRGWCGRIACAQYSRTTEPRALRVVFYPSSFCAYITLAVWPLIRTQSCYIIISADSSCDKDVSRRIGIASAVVRNLDDTWKSKEITADTKVKLPVPGAVCFIVHQ